MSKYQPRYKAYLKTTNEPKNYLFMAFITRMKKDYLRDRNIPGASILDHDDFTEYIQEKTNE